jgi:glycosyltransferase involved in cell wall biosynthesis
MEKNCKLSLIIPIFNGSKFISACLDSIFSQNTIFCFEVIVINDGSTDNTEQILLDYRVLSDGPLRVFTILNSGPSKARHYGLQQSLGDFVMFLDVDDLISPTFFKILYKYIFFDNIDIIVGQFEVRRSGKIIRKSSYSLTNAGLISDFLTGALPSTLWPCLFNRNVLKNLNFYFDYIVGEDFLLNCQLISSGNVRYLVLDEVIYVHNYTKLSLSKSPTFEKYKQNFSAYSLGIEMLRKSKMMNGSLEFDFCSHLINYFVSLILIGSPFAVNARAELRKYSAELVNINLSNMSLMKRLVYYKVMYLPFNAIFLRCIRLFRYRLNI